MTTFQYDEKALKDMCTAYVLHVVNDDIDKMTPCETKLYKDLHGNSFMHVVYSVGGPRAELFGSYARGLFVVSFGPRTVASYVPPVSWREWWDKRGPLLDFPI